MAEFDQSPATRQAMHQAAEKYLQGHILSGTAKARAAELGVTPRTVERWRASISGSAAQKRKPNLLRIAAKAPSLKVYVTGDFMIGGDPEYKRLNKKMEAEFGHGESESLLYLALTDPDEAYQLFFEQYIIPPGDFDNVPSIRFI